MTATDSHPRRIIRRMEYIGFAMIAVLFGGVGVWAATSHIAGAVIAPGTVVVESNVKKVQHPTGGVVASILVNEGDPVEAGQVVMRLDDTVTRASAGVVRSQLDEWQSRAARLIAERDDVEAIAFPDDLLARKGDAQLAATLSGEEKLFESRRDAKLGQRSQLRERVSQSHEEIRGLEAQQAAKEREVGFIGEELIGVTELYDKNLIPLTRVMALRRDKARLEGERGQYISEIAKAKGKISETELQIIQIDKDFRSDVLKDLREAQGKIAELKDRLIAAEDQLKRIDIRAPLAGIVHQLAVHTVGGVIANGEVVMQIIPRADTLIVEAKVAPQDIDQLSMGNEAIVRIQAGEARVNPDLKGKLILVSSDLTHEKSPNGAPAPPYYSVRVSLPKDEVAKLGGLKLVPGMPAEVFVQTYARTPLQYLIKPLKDQMARTFRER